MGRSGDGVIGRGGDKNAEARGRRGARKTAMGQLGNWGSGSTGQCVKWSMRGSRKSSGKMSAGGWQRTQLSRSVNSSTRQLGGEEQHGIPIHLPSRFCWASVGRGLLIGLSAVPHVDDVHDFLPVVYVKNDSVIPNANSKKIRTPSDFHRARGTRIRCHGVDGFANPSLDGERETGKLPGRRCADENSVLRHASAPTCRISPAHPPRRFAAPPGATGRRSHRRCPPTGPDAAVDR